MQYKIKRLFLNDKRKDGTPYIDKRGRPFKMLNVYFEGVEKSASGLCYEDSDLLSWKEGNSVDCELVENNGYLNIKIPSRMDNLEKRLNVLENYVRGLALKCVLKPSTTQNAPTPHSQPQNAPQVIVEPMGGFQTMPDNSDVDINEIPF